MMTLLMIRETMKRAMSIMMSRWKNGNDERNADGVMMIIKKMMMMMIMIREVWIMARMIISEINQWQ